MLGTLSMSMIQLLGSQSSCLRNHDKENLEVDLSKLTDLANEGMCSSIVPGTCIVQPSATISEHFHTVFITEQVVRLVSGPLGEC